MSIAEAQFEYPFTDSEFMEANREWGCNCGPAALAFALHVPLPAIRTAIPDFEAKRYTSPTMMRAALKSLGIKWTPSPLRFAENPKGMPAERMALVRIQWTGPWTSPGSNPRWAYRQTHWVAAFLFPRDYSIPVPCVFDCNGGMRTRDDWESDIVPLITRSIPRADGDWFVTHCWEIAK